jgi:hypothetical protein
MLDRPAVSSKQLHDAERNNSGFAANETTWFNLVVSHSLEQKQLFYKRPMAGPTSAALQPNKLAEHKFYI